MKLRATLFSDARKRSSVSASFSLFASGNCSGRPNLMFFGTVASSNASIFSKPNSRSISAVSVWLGPMCRSAKLAVVSTVSIEAADCDSFVVLATGFSIVSVWPECIVKDYGGQWVLQVTRSQLKLLRIVCLHAVLAQFLAQRGKMLAISRFHGTKDMHCRHVGVGKGAIMYHLFDTGAGQRDLRGQIRQAAGAIANDRDKPRQSAVSNKSAFNYPAQDIWINISTTEKKHHAFASEIAQRAG